MVHFSPLEGDPAFPGAEVVFERAQDDLRVLLEGGVGAVLFENNFDNPKFETLPETHARHFRELVEHFSKGLPIPWGVSALWNDYALGLRLCRDFGGTMIRVPVFVDTVKTVYGVFEAHPERTLATRRDLGAEDVRILADVQVKHATMLHPRPLSQSVREAVASGADEVVITGSWTGDPPTVSMAREAKEAAEGIPVVIGSGITLENIRTFLPFIDGCIVGTTFKASKSRESAGPNVVGPEVRYDSERICRLMTVVKSENQVC